MKRDWDVIKVILEKIENNFLDSFINDGLSVKPPYCISDEVLLGHIEILVDAGIIKHAEVQRNSDGSFNFWDLRGVYITMSGHDLLDALRDQKIWNAIKLKSKQIGISLSWEFIKASIPIVIQNLVK